LLCQIELRGLFCHRRENYTPCEFLVNLIADQLQPRKFFGWWVKTILVGNYVLF
jgi:hypothetical protein